MEKSVLQLSSLQNDLFYIVVYEFNRKLAEKHRFRRNAAEVWEMGQGAKGHRMTLYVINILKTLNKYQIHAILSYL